MESFDIYYFIGIKIGLIVHKEMLHSTVLVWKLNKSLNFRENIIKNSLCPALTIGFSHLHLILSRAQQGDDYLKSYLIIVFCPRY